MFEDEKPLSYFVTMTDKFKKIFQAPTSIIGMIHVPALPGTPGYGGSVQAIIDQVMEEQEIYLRAGIDALMIENMHDIPYLHRKVGPEITALMAVIAKGLKDATVLPCGIQILAGANEEALAAAQAGGLDFIRAEGFVFAHVADEGLMESDAGTLLRYRKAIDAAGIAVFTDLKKKHSSHAITQDVDLLETAEAAAFFRSDALIITGTSTGKPAKLEDFQKLREKIKLPLLAGSGVNLENAENYFPVCDALIVGSWFKKEGYWENDLEYDRVAAFMSMVRDKDGR